MARYGAVKKGIKRYGKSAGRYLKRAATQRYMNSKGNIAYGKIIKDVKYLKSVLNPEKKIFQLSVTDQVIGQCDINAQGYYIADITPTPQQGVTSSTRNGNSIRLSTTHIKFQLQAQSQNNGSPIRFKIMVIKVLGPPQSAASVPPSMFNPTSFVTLAGVNAGIIDYNSDRRQDTFRNYVIVRSKTVSIRPNNHTGQAMLITGQMGIKHKSHHVKFTADANNNTSAGQLIMLIVADNGNRSLTTNSTLVGTSALGALTGANLQMDINHWFYDN